MIADADAPNCCCADAADDNDDDDDDEADAEQHPLSSARVISRANCCSNITSQCGHDVT